IDFQLKEKSLRNAVSRKPLALLPLLHPLFRTTSTVTIQTSILSSSEASSSTGLFRTTRPS
ncbi:hypothetical protein E4U44_000812, partial [Claviceps purpurea]